MTLLQLGTIINSSGFAMAVLHDRYIRRITFHMTLHLIGRT